MKKLNKKVLLIGLIVLFFSVSLIFLVRAQEGEQPFYTLLKYTQDFKINVRQENGTVAVIAQCIDNVGPISYFIPNKTKREIDSFLARLFNDTVSGVSFDNICINGSCDNSDGETAQNNPDDYSTSYCGDSVCNSNETCACADCPTCQTYCTSGAYTATMVRRSYFLILNYKGCCVDYIFFRKPGYSPQKKVI